MGHNANWHLIFWVVKGYFIYIKIYTSITYSIISSWGRVKWIWPFRFKTSCTWNMYSLSKVYKQYVCHMYFLFSYLHMYCTQLKIVQPSGTLQSPSGNARAFITISPWILAGNNFPVFLYLTSKIYRKYQKILKICFKGLSRQTFLVAKAIL